MVTVSGFADFQIEFMELLLITNQNFKYRFTEPVQAEEHQSRLKTGTAPDIANGEKFVQNVEPEHPEKPVAFNIVARCP